MNMRYNEETMKRFNEKIRIERLKSYIYQKSENKKLPTIYSSHQKFDSEKEIGKFEW